jgi:hypothetical protein
MQPEQVTDLVAGDVGQRVSHLNQRRFLRHEYGEGVHEDDGLLHRSRVEGVHVVRQSQ